MGETPTLLEAVKRHFRPELLNRLTKVVHFKPLGRETIQEILGKLVVDFNKRLADRNVTAGRERGRTHPPGRIQQEYGTINLERAMDCLLDSLVAEGLLSVKIEAGQTIRLEAVGSGIQSGEGFSL